MRPADDPCSLDSQRQAEPQPLFEEVTRGLVKGNFDEATIGLRHAGIWCDARLTCQYE